MKSRGKGTGRIARGITGRVDRRILPLDTGPVDDAFPGGRSVHIRIVVGRRPTDDGPVRQSA